MAIKLTKEDVAKIIEDFINGTGEEWDWDDFISIPINDPELETIRVKCGNMPKESPPELPNHYCGEKGIEIMNSFIKKLRKDQSEK